MSKKCAKCEKTVYPLEELKCLDKIWHKTCFRCWECNMTLNMKNYKGFDKKPYCSAHYPTITFTQVSETPEMARLAQNTKLQSQQHYHEQFERNKGKYTMVTDDPETRRLLSNTQNISSIAYHDAFEKSKGHYTAVTDDPETLRLRQSQQLSSSVKYHEDFERMKGTKTSVVDDPESLRLRQQQAIISNVEYHGLKQKQQDMEQKRNLVDTGENINAGMSVPYDPPLSRQDPHAQPMMQKRPPGSISDDHAPSPYSSRNSGSSVMYSAQGNKVQQSSAGPVNVGRIQDYDPLNDQHGSIVHQPYSTQTGGVSWSETAPNPHMGHNRQPTRQDSPPFATNGGPPAQGPSIPVGQNLAVMVHSPPEPARTEEPPYMPEQQQSYYPANPEPARVQQQHRQEPIRQEPPPPQNNSNPLAGAVFKAMYDYEAAEEDEIGFRDGDIIVNPEPIDEGWMYGTVQRTGITGMLPANYVQRIK